MLTDERTQHDYRRCRDEDCQRYACRIWREAHREGYDEGYNDGYGAGHAAGYSAGYAAGAASSGDG